MANSLSIRAVRCPPPVSADRDMMLLQQILSPAEVGEKAAEHFVDPRDENQIEVMVHAGGTSPDPLNRSLARSGGPWSSPTGRGLALSREATPVVILIYCQAPA